MGGGGFTGAMDACDGNDIIQQLNEVFGHPHSEKYRYAQSHNTFGTVGTSKDNWQELVTAYTTAGVDVSGAWSGYLQALGGLSPDNISAIAKTRNNCLTTGGAMLTRKHVPTHGGRVHVEECTIDSPYPLTA
jgi:hypothetical protein